MCIMGGPQISLAESVSHQVTIQVPTINIFSADRESFVLSFNDFVKGAVSNQQNIIYTVRVNNLQREHGVVEAKLSNTISPNLELQADVGAYVKEAGNASLRESASGFIPITESPVSLCDKQTDSGDGRVARGTFSVVYQAVAKEDLAAGDVPITLTVSLLDT